MNTVIIPPTILLVSLVFQVISLWFSIRITKKIGLSFFNWLTGAMIIGLVRRMLDYLITFNQFSSFRHDIRYIELAFFPILFSIFIILGFIQVFNVVTLIKYKYHD